MPEDRTGFNDTKCLQALCKPHVTHIKKNKFGLFGQVQSSALIHSKTDINVNFSSVGWAGPHKIGDVPTGPSPLLMKSDTDGFGHKQHNRFDLSFTCLRFCAMHVKMLSSRNIDSAFSLFRNQSVIISLGTTRAQCSFAQSRRWQTGNLPCRKEHNYVLNAPHASHAGGVCEQQIRTERNVFDSTLSLSGCRCNDPASRPLTTDNLNDPNSLETPSPEHLITIKVTTPYLTRASLSERTKNWQSSHWRKENVRQQQRRWLDPWSKWCQVFVQQHSHLEGWKNNSIWRFLWSYGRYKP